MAERTLDATLRVSARRIEARARPEADARLLVALHGYGGTPGMIEPAVRSLRADTSCLLARAPFPLRQEPEGTVGYAWMVSAKGRHDAEGRRLSEDLVVRALEGAGPHRTPPVLLGFSQGAFLAITTALTHPGRFGGVLALAGWANPEVTAELLAKRPRVGIVLIHGTEDDLVPIARAREALRLLTDGGVPARLVAVPGGHRFGREMATAVREALEGWWGKDSLPQQDRPPLPGP